MASQKSDQSDAIIDHATRRLLAKVEQEVQEHPNSDELASYQQDRLPAAAAAKVRQHLVACADCAQLVLELESFDGEPPPEHFPSPAEEAAAWERFRSRLQLEPEPVARVEAGPSQQVARRGSSQGGFFHSSSPFWRMVAVLLVGIGSFWLGRLEMVEETTDSAEIPFIFELLPAGSEIQRAATRHSIEVPQGFQVLVPRLRLGNQDSFPAFVLELIPPQGKPRRFASIRQPDGSFAVTLARSELPAGTYRLTLWGVGVPDPSAESVLAEYSFELRYVDP